MAELFQASWWTLYDTWPLDRVTDFDQSVDNFELAWQCGQSPDIATILERVSNEERLAWLAELMAVEVIARTLRGESQSKDEFLARFPSDNETVIKVWAEVTKFCPTVTQRVATDKSALPAKKGGAWRGRHLSQNEILDGRYQVESFEKQGGMGELYRARRLIDGRTVAVKVLSYANSNTPSPDSVPRFLREIKILCDLHHQHLASAIEPLQLFQRPPMIVMDWIEGQNLEEIVRKTGPMPWPSACEVIRQAADGLEYAWRKLGLVHRDIKPANLMLTSSGEVIVLDFGLARAAVISKTGIKEPLTSVGAKFGTPPYMAPEQWDDPTDVLPTADVYGLGGTLFYLLTGKTPFWASESSEQSLAKAHREFPPPDVIQIRPDIPVELAQFVQRMLAKVPSDRPADGNELMTCIAAWTADADLRRFAEGSKPIFLATESNSKNHRRHRLLSRRSTIVAGAVFVGTAAALGWWLWPPSLPSPKAINFNVDLCAIAEHSSFRKIGEIGHTASSAQAGSPIWLRIHFNAPVYSQLFAVNPNGSIQLLVVGDDDGSPAQEKRSGALEQLQFPQQVPWNLDDLPGLQAFVLIMSRSPLPSFQRWWTVANWNSDWSETKQGGVWTAQANRLQAVLLEDESPRGQPAATAPEALERLWSHVLSQLPARATAALIAFPLIT